MKAVEPVSWSSSPRPTDHPRGPTSGIRDSAPILIGFSDWSQILLTSTAERVFIGGRRDLRPEQEESVMKKRIAALASVPVLVLGGAAVAGAQTGGDNPTDTSSDPAPVEAPAPTHVGRRGPRAGGPEAMAEALGMDPSELRDAVRGGQTIAEVAESRGVDIDAVISDLVDQAEARVAELDNPQAAERFDAEKLTERLTALVNGEIRPGPRGPHGPRGPRAGVDGAGGADSTPADSAPVPA